MFATRKQNITPSRLGMLDLHSLGDVIRRLLPFAGRRSVLGTIVQHLGTVPLTAQSSLALVRVYKETLVLGITPQSVTLLAKADTGSSHEDGTPIDTAPAEEQNIGLFLNDSHGRKSQSS